MFTSGPMACTSTFAWKTSGNAFWCCWGPRRRGTRKSSPSVKGIANRSNRGGRCCWTAKRVVWRSSRSWPSRMCLGLLEGVAQSVVEDAWPALLGAQDGQCAGQDLEGSAVKGQGDVARYLDGGFPDRGRQSLRSFPQGLGGEISQGHGVSDQGSRSVASVLRFSCRALAAHSHHESDRVGPGHGAVTNVQDQRLRQPPGLRDDGVQVNGKCQEGMEEAQRLFSPSGRDSRSQVCRWRKGNRRRRLNRTPSTTFGNNSRLLSLKVGP